MSGHGPVWRQDDGLAAWEVDDGLLLAASQPSEAELQPPQARAPWEGANPVDCEASRSYTC